MEIVQDAIAVVGPVLALRVDLEAFTEACHKLNRCRHTLSIILRQAGVFPTAKLKLHADRGRYFWGKYHPPTGGYFWGKCTLLAEFHAGAIFLMLHVSSLKWR